MSLFHQNSSESIHSGLDLFSLWPTQTSVENGDYVEYRPLGSIESSTAIEFFINNKQSEEYIDLSKPKCT